MIKLYKEEIDGKNLVQSLKVMDEEIYKKIYKENKILILESSLENKQKTLLDVINKELAYKFFEEPRFLQENKDEIDTLIENELSFDNLESEYNLYQKKLSLIPENENLTYEEIMSFEYDEDEILFNKDFKIMMMLIQSIKNLYLWGNAGNGKTTFAYKVASELGLKLYNINSVKNEFSVKGFFDLEGKYNKSLYEMWYENGGILLLDECDSYSSNGMLYLNNGIEVNSKYLTLENGEQIMKHKDCYVIACANTDGLGKTSDYIGRNAIDKAFMSRFSKKEYKEYAFIHKEILGDKKAYKEFKTYFDTKGIELTCRLCVKLKSLLTMFTSDEIKKMIDLKEIEL